MVQFFAVSASQPPQYVINTNNARQKNKLLLDVIVLLVGENKKRNPRKKDRAKEMPNAMRHVVRLVILSNKEVLLVHGIVAVHEICFAANEYR